MDFDVVIIGGGPAGSMSGIELQKQGFRTCIIDKSVFPRPKLCGGLLTKKTLDLLDYHCPGINRKEYVSESTNSVDFYLKERKVTTFETRVSYYFTERKTFDALLIREYRNHGGIVFEGLHIKPDEVDWRQNRIRTTSNEYTYKALIGADGCNSLLTRINGIRRYDSFCLEGERKRDRQDEKIFRIYFGVSKNGYGWYFPRKDVYAIGIGGNNRGKTMQEKADLFFSGIVKEKIEHRKGAFIPSGRLFRMGFLPENIIIAGDAAGLIDPITGEGIYYALLSGVFAAEAIAGNLHSGSCNVLKAYARKIKPIRGNVRVAYAFQKVLYSPFALRLFMNYLKTHKSFARFYLEKVMSTGQFSYLNFIGSYLFRKIKYGKLRQNTTDMATGNKI